MNLGFLMILLILLNGYFYTFIVIHYLVEYGKLEAYLVAFGELCSLHFVIPSSGYVLL